MSRFEKLRSFFSGVRYSDDTPPPYFLRFRSSKWFILITICIAVFTDIFLYAVIVPVLPFALSERVGVPADDVQRWVSILLALYAVGLLVASPIAGWYADRSSSRRFPLLFGLLALAGSTLLLCLARLTVLLIIGRLFQGFAGAIVWTVGQALIVDTVGEKEVGYMMGFAGISLTMGLLLGPLLGGVVYNSAGYYAVFYICFGMIALDIILRLAMIEKKIAKQWLAPDIDLVPTAPATKKQPDVPPDPITPELISNLEATTATPRSGPAIFTLLKSRRLLAALWGCFIISVSWTAFDGALPIFVKGVFDWGADGGGLIFLAAVTPNILAPLAGYLSDHYGPRWFVFGGFLMDVPLWVLLRLVTENTIQQKVLLCALLALIGCCLTFVITPVQAEISYLVEAMEKNQPGIFGKKGAYGLAYGLFVSSFALGNIIGPLWGGLVAQTAGWSTMVWTVGLLNAVGAVPALVWTGGLITEKNAKSGDERATGVVEARASTNAADA